MSQGYIASAELDQHEKEDQQLVQEAQKQAWDAYIQPILTERTEVANLINQLASNTSHQIELERIKDKLLNIPAPFRREMMSAVNDVFIEVRDEQIPGKQSLMDWKNTQDQINRDYYSTHLYSQSVESALQVPEVKPVYSKDSPILNGYEIINAYF